MQPIAYISLSLIVIIYLIVFTIFFGGRGFRNSNLFIALFLMAVNLVNSGNFLFNYHQELYIGFFIGIEYFMFAFAPVFIFLFTKSNGGLDIRFKKNYFHFIPALILLALVIVYWCMPIHFREAFSQSKLRYENVIFNLLDFILYSQLVIYMVISLSILKKAEKIPNPVYKQGFLLQRIKTCRQILWVILVFVWLTIPFGCIENGRLFDKYIVFYMFLVTFIVIIFNAIINPHFYARLTPSMYLANGYSKLLQSDLQMMERIDQKLNEELIKNNLFLQADLTIDKLAIMMAENKKNISKVISYKYQKSFIDFMNQLRVEKAKELLSNKEFSKYTLEGIGKMSGFSSRSGFYNVFKKITGCTPAQFRAKQA